MNRFIVIALLFFGAAQAQEITVGQTIRPGGVSGGQVYELSYYPYNKHSWLQGWRLSIGHVAATRFKQVPSLACGSLGSLGSVCTRKPFTDIDSFEYVSATYLYPVGDAYVGMGIAVHEKRIPFLGENFSFTPTLGYRFGDNWSVEYTHKSNAGLGTWNYGHDALMFRYRF